MFKMADEGRREEAVFFIYDHNMLKKEEDDLIGAILYFSPEHVSADDQCALCGQLMGMAEYLTATLGKSSPKIFKFEHEKFAIKRVSGYSLGLQFKRNDPDSVAFKQLDYLYGTFVTFHGSFNSLRLRCKDNNNNFTHNLGNIWHTILSISGVSLQLNLAKTFQHLPYIQLPKTGSHLFLQASHLLQSSQRRPYVLGGAILYKNEVVCTQLPPTLTRQLTYLQVQMPHIERKMDFELPVGCKICTLFLTDEELLHIFPLDQFARRHCKITDFTSRQESDVSFRMNTKSAQTKLSSRRQTCPNIASSLNLYDSHHDHVTKHPEQSNPSLFDNVGKGSIKKNANFIGVDRHSTWGKGRTKMSLSHVPIVECRHGESPVDSATETLTDIADESYFGKSYRSSAMNEPFSIECLKADIDYSDNDSEDDLGLGDTEKDESDDKNKSQSTDMSSDKEVSNSQKLNASNNFESETSNSIDVKNTKTISENLNTNEFVPINNKGNEANGAKHAGLTNKNGLNFTRNYSDSESDVKESVICPTIQVKVEIHKPKCDNNNESLININGKESSKITFENDKAENVARTENICENGNKSDNQPSIEVDSSIGNSLTDNTDKGNFSNSGTDVGNCDSDEKSVTVVGTESKLERGSSKYGDEKENTVQRQDNIDSGAKMKNVVNKTESLESNEQNINSGSQSVDLEEDKSSSSVSNKAQQSLDGKGKIDTEKQHEGENITNDNDDNIESEKENITPEIPPINKENNLKSKDISNMNDNDEPCISCLELRSENMETESNKQRCSQCLSKKKSQIINHFDDRKEVIDFSVRGEHQDSSANHAIDASDTETFNQSVISTETVSSSTLTFSSNVSTDSTISRFWTHEMDGLNDVTLYVQCHSDISLLLLMENPEQYQENLLHSLWKGSLHYLADLDFYIKECLEQEENVPIEHFSFTQFNKFSRDLKGNQDSHKFSDEFELWPDRTSHFEVICPQLLKKAIDDIVQENVGESSVKKKRPFNDIVAALHAEFDYHPALNDLTLRNQANSCYGHRSEVNETFFQLDGPTRLTSGLPVSKDPNYTLDTVAKTKLAKDRHISLM